MVVRREVLAVKSQNSLLELPPAATSTPWHLFAWWVGLYLSVISSGTGERSLCYWGDFSLLFRAKYMEYYASRDLKAFSAEPLLVYPTHYTGQPGYLSDTETSTTWDNETVSTDWDRTHSWKSRQQGRIHSAAQHKDALPSQSSLNAPSSRDEL